MERVEPPRNFSRFSRTVSASGMPLTAGQVYWLWRSGHRIIVSLDPDLPGEVLEAIRELGFKHILIPVVELSPPTLSQMLDFIGIVRRAEASGRRLLVHCYAGCGRTGTMLAAILVDRGLTADEAIRVVRERRPCSIETYGQEEAVRLLWRTIHGGLRKR